MKFYASPTCRSGVHCNTCRNLDGGREWRASIVEHANDVDAVDFACPKGLEWGASVPLPVLPQGLGLRVPADYDPVEIKRGGCCGPPTEA